MEMNKRTKRGKNVGKPVSWIMIAPSITPRKALGGSNNPAMRLYKFETDTGQVSCAMFAFREYVKG